MAVKATPIYPQSINTWAKSFVNADGTNIVDILTAGADGTKIEALFATSTLSSGTFNLILYLNDGTNDYQIAYVLVTNNAGNSATVFPVDLLKSSSMYSMPIDANGNRYLFLQNGWKLRASVTTAVTSGATNKIDLIVSGANF